MRQRLTNDARFSSIVSYAKYILINAVKAAIDVMLDASLVSELEESDAPVSLCYLANAKA